MSKRNPSDTKLISVNVFTSPRESLVSVAILNALEILKAKEKGINIPSRKELTHLLKTTTFENFCKVFEELNHVCIRKVPCIEAIGEVGIVQLDHPVLGIINCFAYRDMDINEDEYKLVNSGLGNDEVVINVFEQFNTRLESEGNEYYQVFLNTGEKQMITHKEYSCNECCHYSLQNSKDICLYDNKELSTTKECCTKYLDCFKWHRIGE